MERSQVIPKLIVLEEGADLDALSASLAVLKLFPDALLLTPKYLSRRASKVFKDFKHLFRLTREMPQSFDLILVDTQYLPEGIPKEGIRKVYIFDHHPKRADFSFEGKVEEVGSATTLVVEELIKEKKEISPEEATVIALGIYEDTGSFTYEGTCERDLRATAWLMERGLNLRLLRKYIQETYTKEQLDAVGQILSSVEKLYIGGKKIAVATAVLEDYQPDINALLYEVKDLKEADAFFVIVEAQGKTYVFGRSQDEEIDVGKILSKFGGGGHRDASALKLKNVPAQRIKNLLVGYLRTLREPEVTVGSVMSSPPFLLSEHLSVRDALQELTERGFANAPVIDRRGNLVGIISKKALLKLVKLYPEDPIELFASKDFKTLSPSSPLWEAEAILSQFGQKLIPVVEEGKVVGVVTRLDILQRLKEDLGYVKPAQRHIRIPPYLEGFLKDIGRLASELGFKAYLVGGAVRDLLLRKEVYDVDIVVEGRAIDLARRVAERFGVEVHPFEEFGTAHIKVGDIKVEFATARRETYPKPGAYPKVEEASLKEDLIRRDFTVNAMALSINPEDFGTLIDYFGGLRDLKDRIIRILHPVSFIEDPVRILRALRFAGRLDFRLSKSTEKLLRQAVNLGLLEEAPRGRIANEIRLAFGEDRILEILHLYKTHRIFEHILKSFRWIPEVEEKLARLKKIVDWHSVEFPKERIDYGWVFLVLVLSQVGKREEAEKFLAEVSAPSWARKTYGILSSELGRIRSELLRAEKNSEIYGTLKGFHVSLLLILMTESKLQEKVRKFIRDLRFVKVPEEVVERLKAQGYGGRDLGERIEKIREEIMDSESLKIRRHI